MKQNPSVWEFLRELVNRIGTKNPKFFNVLAWIASIAAFITGLPLALSELGIQLPEAWEAMQNKIIMWCGIVVVVISNLTTQRPVETTGRVANTVTTKSEVLPFTAKAEKKQSAK